MEKSNTEYGKTGKGGSLNNIVPKATTVDEVYTELI